MNIALLLPVILFIGFIILFLAWLSNDDDKALVISLFSLVAACLTLIQGVIGYEAAKKEAVATGNAYYKQIIDEKGDVSNEFHWRVEKKEEKKCDCEKCKAHE